jgi:hypothetical protein
MAAGMTEDIVDRLERWDDQQPPFAIMREAAEEITLLRRALELAIGELSTFGQFQALHPEQLLTNFKLAAVSKKEQIK